MKLKFQYLVFFCILCIVIVKLVSIEKDEVLSEIQGTSIEEKRNNHHQFLENSPFKETLKLSKQERKSQGLPPNKYYEREWELTMNPQTGLPEPQKVLEFQNERNNIKGKVPDNGNASNNWVDRGPNNVGGRTRVVLFDPNDSTNKRVFAGAVSGGLWVNNDITNINSTWSLVSGIPVNMNVSCITVDPRDSNTWYIGTGEQYTFGAAVGNGVYKTEDGGDNWVNVTVQLAGVGNLSSSTDTFLSGIYYINDIIAWDNGTSTEVFIGVGGHMYGDAANPNNWTGLQSAGLYRSTDNGLSWDRIESLNMEFQWSGFDFYYIPNDFEISADNTLWMGMIETPGIGGGGGGRIFSSTNGAVWTEPVQSPLNNSNRVELATSSSNPNKIYALTEGTTTSGPHIYGTNNAFSSVSSLAKPNDADNGISASDFTRGQDFYNLVIEVDPTDDDIIYVGGIDLFRSVDGVSTNLTSEWAQISKWSENPGLDDLFCSYVHADQHAFVFRPGNSNQAVIGCDGGVYYANDLSGAELSSGAIIAMNSDYNVTQFYYGGYGPNASNELLLGGAQDNGSQFVNGANSGANASFDTWGGDGAYSTIDMDGDYMITSYVYSNHYYYKLPYSGINFPDWINNPDYEIDSNDSEGDFINPAGLDHNLNILFSNGSNKINRYVLGANSSTKAQLANALLDGSPTAFKVSPYTTTSSTVLVGTDNGKLLKLSNADGTAGNIIWEDITGPAFIGSVSSIEFGETENDIFVTFHNYNVESVWYSSTSGKSWKNKEGNLPDIPIKCLLQNPLARNEVIVGSQLGVFVSTNFNEDTPVWTSSNNGMRDVKVVDLDLRTSDNSILATTFGRGFFTGTFSNSTNSTFEISPLNSIVEVCVPDDGIFNFNFEAYGGYNSNSTITVSGEPSGASVSISPTTLNSSGSFSITFGNLENVTSGQYIISITGTGGGKSISKDIVLVVRGLNVQPVFPANGASGINIDNFSFSWEDLFGANSYDIEIATDPSFSNIIESGNTTTNEYQLLSSLNASTVYYWRVRVNSICGQGEFSETQNFQTYVSIECDTTGNNSTLNILDLQTTQSIINIPSGGNISDVNVFVDISHSYLQDLYITLLSPNGTDVVLFDRNCSTNNDLSVTFDDAGSNFSCVNRIGFTLTPEEVLSDFNYEDSTGDWTLSITDNANVDTGTLNNWSVEICSFEASVNTFNVVNIPIIVGAGTPYTFNTGGLEVSTLGNLANEHIFTVTQTPIKGDLKLNNISLGLGDSFSQADINAGNLSYVNVVSGNSTDKILLDVVNTVTNGFLPNLLIDITIDAALGVPDSFLLSSGISVYPTISNGNFSVSSKKSFGDTTIELFSITGQKVYEERITLNKGYIQHINTSKFSSGIYILKVSSQEVNGSKKLIFK